MPDRTPLTFAFQGTVKLLNKGQVEHADGGCPGLRPCLSHGGAATWVLGFRDAVGREV